MRFLRHHRPAAFILENVPNLAELGAVSQVFPAAMDADFVLFSAAFRGQGR